MIEITTGGSDMSVYSVSDTAEMLKVNEETVRRWIRDGKLKANRNLGRNGNIITLSDIIDFVNTPPGTYLNVLSKWLDKNNISYQKVEVNNKDRVKQEAKIGAAVTTLGATLGVIAPSVAPIAAATFAPIAAAKIGDAISANKRNVPYKIKLVEKEEKNFLTDMESVGTKITSSPIQIGKDKINFADKDRGQNREKIIKDKIIDEQMKLIRLKQELAQITAQITICENQIEYYNILLQKQEE